MFEIIQRDVGKVAEAATYEEISAKYDALMQRRNPSVRPTMVSAYIKYPIEACEKHPIPKQPAASQAQHSLQEIVSLPA